MDKLIREYIEKTGAFGASVIKEDKEYGTVYEIQYGEKDEDGNIEPTGLPVLAYIKDGEVATILGFDALDFISELE